MIFLASMESWKSGLGGRSRVRMRYGVIVLLTVEDSSKRRRSPVVSDFAVMTCDSMRSLPWKVRWTIDESALVLDPPRVRCRLLRNQDKNSTGSD